MSDREPPDAPRRFLVPIERSLTLRNTVAHVMGTALDRTADGGEATVHFVHVLVHEVEGFGAEDELARGEELLDRVRSWGELDLADADGEHVSTETAMIGRDELLFGPTDYADRLYEYARRHDIDRIVLDPEYNPGGAGQLLQPLEFELARKDIHVTEAPVDRPARRTRLRRQVTTARFLGVFGVSLALYLLLGHATEPFDLATGLITAALTAGVLSSISVARDPTLRHTPLRIARGVIYIPYLLVEIVKANLQVAAVILHPQLPIEPRMTRIQCRVIPGVPMTTLANSITLTPGTLTVRARDQDLYVHTLLPSSREDLFDGRLEKWVRFIFGGRSAARAATPRERGDTAVLQGPEADEPLFPSTVRSGTIEPPGSEDDSRGDEP